MLIQPKEYFLSFSKKEKIAEHTYSFYFDRTQYPFSFEPGQYMKMFLPLSVKDERGSNRSFTISSSPHQKDKLVITTKVTEDSSPFKKTLLNLMDGEEVRFFGPMGGFVLPNESSEPLILLAGGIGITTFYSMILYASELKYKRPIILLVSFSSQSDMIYYEELTALAEKNEMLTVVYTLSKEQKGWFGETGRLSAQLLIKYVKNPKMCDYMICGPSEMVATMLDLLADMKVPPEQVKEEQFTGY